VYAFPSWKSEGKVVWRGFAVARPSRALQNVFDRFSLANTLHCREGLLAARLFFANAWN
jgi:hypothetical protein